jgi:FixJ family two-component response regulator
MTTDAATAVLYIVDANASVRSALCRLAISAGFEAHPFESVERFIAPAWPSEKACVILDSSLLVAGGQLREAMKRRGVDWPVIVLCAGDNDVARHDARGVGARFLLNKPVDAQALLDAIAWVTEADAWRND